jgi:hypothetical protein
MTHRADLRGGLPQGDGAEDGCRAQEDGLPDERAVGEVDRPVLGRGTGTLGAHGVRVRRRERGEVRVTAHDA